MKNFILIISLLLSILQIYSQDNPEKTQKYSKLLFKSTTYDFGILNYGADVKGEFICKNVSKDPIKITNVKTSCGCTYVEWPKEEIKKNKKVKIYIGYDTYRVGKFDKAIYVYIDEKPEPIQLRILGEVLAPVNNKIEEIKESSKTKK